jgi:hypothetical protein
MNMRSYKEFLIESKKQYTFRVKVAGEVTDEQLEMLEANFDRWGLASLSKPKRTPIQQHPQDFPNITNSEISVMELVLDYPATPAEVAQCMHNCCNIPMDNIRVYNDGDPLEAAREDSVEDEDEEYEVQLTAPYAKSSKDHPYGDKFNKQFLKDLEKMPKMKIAGGNSSKGTTTNDLPQGKLSPVGSTKNMKPTPRSSAR